MMNVVGNKCTIKTSDLPVKLINDIKQELTYTVIGYGGKENVHQLYTVEEKDGSTVIQLPRVFGVNKLLSHDPNIKYTISGLTEGDAIPQEHLNPKAFALTSMQLEYGKQLVEKHFSRWHVEHGCAGATAVLPTGTGKTFIGFGAIRLFKRKTLFITNTDVSARKIVLLMKKCNPNITTSMFKDLGDLGEFIDGTTEFNSPDVLVTTVHKFVLQHTNFSRALSQERSVAAAFIKSRGFVIYDEVHTLGGPQFSKIFDMFSPVYQLGLTATPIRRDGAEIKYLYTVGPSVELSEEVAAPSFPTVAHCICYRNPDKNPSDTWVYSDPAKKHMNASHTVQNITSSDEKRLELLTQIVSDCLLDGDSVMKQDEHIHPVCLDIGPSIIIFCNYHDEIHKVVHHLEGQFPKVQVHTVTGKSPPLGIDAAISNGRIIVTNYYKLGTAFSEPRFIYCILWSTTRSLIKQAVGRIGRYCEETPEWNEQTRHVYDIVDDGTLCAIQFRDRKTFYKESNFNVRRLRWRLDDKLIV